MKVRVQLLLVCVALASCGGQTQSPPREVAKGSPEHAGSDAGGQLGGGAAEPPVSAGAGGDAGAASVEPKFDPISLSPEETAYLGFLGDAAQARYEHMVECFQASDADFLATGDAERLLALVYEQRDALRLGTVAFDAAKAAACLRAIEDASCQDFAVQHAFYGSGDCNVLVGAVLPGGSCLGDEDCQNPEQFDCRTGNASGYQCSKQCTPRQQEAAPLGDLDEPCRFDACLPGLYCRFTSKGDVAGFCRPNAPGGECEGIWQCPTYYVCDSSDGGGAGSCTIGKAAGEPCQLSENYNGFNSNCSDTLSCYSDGGSPPTCKPGRELGETCGTDPATGVFVKCHTGYCSIVEPSKNTCLPRKNVGEPCSGSAECRSMLCQSGICGPVELHVGSPCKTEADCGLDSFCQFVSDSDLAEGPVVTKFPETGACEAYRQIGETCSKLERCQALSSCVDGVCQRCPG